MIEWCVGLAPMEDVKLWCASSMIIGFLIGYIMPKVRKWYDGRLQ